MPALSFTPNRTSLAAGTSSAGRGIDEHAEADIACGRNIAGARRIAYGHAIADVAGRTFPPPG